jgi:hypothetical protein
MRIGEVGRRPRTPKTPLPSADLPQGGLWNRLVPIRIDQTSLAVICESNQYHQAVHFVESKILMGSVAVAIMFVAYAWQLWKIWTGASKPHPIAWIGFGLLTGIGYLVQYHEGAGAGSWVMGLTAIFCFLIAGMSQYKVRWQKSDFNNWDRAALIFGIGLFVLYLISKHFSWGLTLSAILATLADLVLYIPIFRKAWMLPHDEFAPAYALNSLKFVPSIFAMGAYSTATCLYPSAMIFANTLVVFYLLWRRKRLVQLSIKML